MTSDQRVLASGHRHLRPAANREAAFPFTVGLFLGFSAAIVGVQWNLPLSPSQLIVVFVAVLVVLGHPERVKRYRPNWIDLSVVGFVFTMLAVEIFNAQQLLRDPSPHVSYTWAVLGLAYFAARVTAESRGESFTMLRGFSAIAPLMALLGVLQTLSLSWVIDFTVLLTEGGASALDRYLAEGMLVRATGLTGHWTGYGSYLAAMALCLAVQMRLFGSRWQTVLSLAVVGAGVVSTLTISVIAIYAGVVIMYFIGERRIGRLIAFLLTAAAGLALIFGDELTRRLEQQYGNSGASLAASNGVIPETLVFRMSIWKNETIPAIVERFMTGWGPGAYGNRIGWVIAPETIVWKSSESQWFGILMQAGILGFMAMSCVLISFVVIGRSGPPEVRSLITGFLILCFITSLTVSVFTNAGLGGALLPLLGAISGKYGKSGNRGMETGMKERVGSRLFPKVN